MKDSNSPSIPVVRTLGVADVPAMMALEAAAWPEDVRASEAQLRDRLDVFADGCFGAWIDGRLVGMATCQIVAFEPARGPVSWSKLCADGWIRQTHRRDGNCLHFVSVCVDPEFRSHGVGAALNRARVALGGRCGLDFALTDTRLPGLARYLAQDPGHTPEGYITAILEHAVDEPVVKMYLRLGFRPLGLIAGCMKSDIESADYGLAMLHRYHEASS